MSKKPENKHEIGRRDALLGAGLGAIALLPFGLAGCTDDVEPFDEGTCDPDPQDGATAASDFTLVAEDAALFDLGVQAGSVRAGSVLLWTHATDDAALKVRVWRGANLLAKEADVTPVEGFARVEVAGLAPNTAYSYAFFDASGAKRSGVGKFRTAYDGDCRRALTVGATACTSLRSAPFKALELLATQDFDLMLHLGDMTYNDGSTTTAEFRAKWRATLDDPGYRALLPKAAMYSTWDDHEFMNNTGLYTAPAAVIAAAKATFFEAVPMQPGPNGRLWQSFKWGKTAEFFVLDCRTERKPDTRLGDGATYISDEQLAWFQEGLEKSDAHFKVVLNSVPMIDFPEQTWGLASNDRWEGYAAQREKLLSFITSKGLKNVWFLSGDFHLGIVAKIEPEGPRSHMWEILVGPGANYNPLGLVYTQGSEEEREELAPAAQFKYFSSEFAATTITFDPESDSVHVRFLQAGTGTVLYDQKLSQRA